MTASSVGFRRPEEPGLLRFRLSRVPPSLRAWATAFPTWIGFRGSDRPERPRFPTWVGFRKLAGDVTWNAPGASANLMPPGPEQASSSVSGDP